jgi:hypothetical protein
MAAQALKTETTFEAVRDRVAYCENFEERIRYMTEKLEKTQIIALKSKTDIFEAFEKIRLDHQNEMIKLI